MIKVRYFARLREALGTAEESIELPSGVTTVGELKSWLGERGARWQDELSAPALLMAVNQEAAQAQTPVADGCEVAFFPPVTGG